MSRRRLVTVVAVTMLAVAGLSACRSAPGVAAYVGATQYTDAYVDDLVDGFDADVAEQARAQATAQLQESLNAGRITAEEMAARVDQAVAEQRAKTQQGFGDLRQLAVRMLVIRDAGTAYAKAHDITVKAADPARVAAQNNLPKDNALVRLFAEWSEVMQALEDAAQATSPTEADQREAYTNLAASIGADQLPPFEQVRPGLTEAVMGKAVGMRNLLVDAVESADVSVSPRYASVFQPVQIQIQQASTYLSVQLTAANSAVTQAPAASPSADAAA